MKINFLKKLGWRLSFGLAAATGSLIFFAWLADEVFEGDSKIFDENIRTFFHSLTTPWLTELMIVFSFLGSPVFLVILGATVIAALLYFKRGHAALVFAVTMAGELVLDLTLKSLFARPRPEVFFDYKLPSSSSFPSGHALGSLCFYGILAWLAASHLSSFKYKVPIYFGAFLMILMIGISRIYLGVHYPSDVIAGYTTGLFWLVVVTTTDRQTGRSELKL